MTRREDLHVVKPTTTVDEGIVDWSEALHVIHFFCFIEFFFSFWGIDIYNYSYRASGGKQNHWFSGDRQWLEIGKAFYFSSLVTLLYRTFSFRRWAQTLSLVSTLVFIYDLTIGCSCWYQVGISMPDFTNDLHFMTFKLKCQSLLLLQYISFWLYVRFRHSHWNYLLANCSPPWLV